MKKILLMLVALIATSFSAMAEDIYIVAGSEELCGTVWDGTDLNNKMTDNGDGTYSKTFTNVAVKNGYQFKVVKNSTEWYGDEADNNITFNVTTACDVTITFNTTTFKSTVTGTGVQAYVFNVEKVVAVGNGVGAWLNGADWVVDADANKMTQVADKVYEISFDNVPVGEEDYMVKFATNGSWADNFGGIFEASGKESDAMYNSGNITFNLEKAGTVTLRLDLSKFDYATRTGAKFVVTLPGSEPAELTYFMKHPWGGGDWTWKPMAKNTDKKFALVNNNDGEVIEYGWIVNGKWGNEGVNINAKEDDTNSKWIAEPHTFSTPQLGEDCRFFYFPEIQDFVIVIPERWAKVETSFDPAPGEYTGPLTVRVKCQNAPCEISKITYFLNDNNDELLYDDAKGIVLTESTNLAAFVNFTDGNTLSAVGKYVITTPTGVNDITTAATTKAQKVIENGQVLIVKDGKKYNLLGNQVK